MPNNSNVFPSWYRVGAQLTAARDAVDFRVWAPAPKRVDVLIGEDRPDITPLEPEGDGYHAAHVPSVGADALYRFRLDGQDAVPDPASRFQPAGPHGPSQVIDPSAFSWSDDSWNGIAIEGQVIYELHVGTFTREGTWNAAARELPRLADLGITVIEVMPVAEFPGRFGWGYDGVGLFAPTRLYGKPDDMRIFVNEAHGHSIAVILDVVYNHFGPDGNYVARFSPDYFTDRHVTDWGEAINFYGDNSGPVREFYSSNAAYWIKEYHLDGLRLDATQNIYDESGDHILAVLTRAAREAAGRRRIIVVGENEPQDVRLIRPPGQGGYGLDALWNDDFHHSATVAMTGRNEAYYTDYLGSPQELLSAAKYGFLFQGQHYRWQRKRRGTPRLGGRPAAVINFLQNHDQVANSARGQRVNELTTFGRFKAMTALLLLTPGTTMLFQGQEFSSSARFLFFADHQDERLARLVRDGRRKFMKQFRSLRRPDLVLDDPTDPATFEACKLDHSESARQAETYALHRDLLALRRTLVFSQQQFARRMDGAVLAAEAFVVRFFSEDFLDDKLLLMNLGRDLHLDPAPEPLLAPPEHKRWAILWSSEDPRYGGFGTPEPDSGGSWNIPSHAAVVLEGR